MTAQRVRELEGSSAPASETFLLMRREGTSRRHPSRWDNGSKWLSLATRRPPFAALMVALLVSAVCAAGQQSPDASFLPRIVNGLTTHAYPAVGAVLRGDFPDWAQHVSITADNAAMFCSGTLIGCRTFLTAGHCTLTMFPPGELDADEAWVYLPNAGIFTVTSIARHPAYTLAGPNVPINDVAVLNLGEPVTGIEPMAINQSDPNTFIPADGTIVGFGNTGGAGAVDKGIKRAGHVETTACPFSQFPFPPDPETKLVCWDFLEPIGPPGDNSDTCGGDSGGPLFLDLGNRPVVAGVTSGGTSSSCTPPDHAFDANIYTYSDFILTQLGTDDTTTCGGLPPVGDPQVEVHGFDGRLDDATPSAIHTVSVDGGKNSVRFGLNAIDTVRRDAPERTFDVNMYVKAGPGASPTDFNCAADSASVFGACVFDLPAAGTYSVFVDRVIGEGNYQLTATIFGGPPPVCGDGNLDFNEQCDDGNTAKGDCCTASCQFEPAGGTCETAGFCDGSGRCVTCAGDCDGKGTVTVDELVKGINITLGNATVDQCLSLDVDQSDAVTVDELVQAVRNALDGCRGG